MSGIFLSLHPYYEDGEILGRKQANSGFINALFRRNPFESYHFFVDNPKRIIKFWEKTPEAKKLWEQGALVAFDRSNLAMMLKKTPYSVCHFSGPMTEFSALCQARNTFAPHIFPVTAVNHTVSYLEHAEKILTHIWQGCTPRDGVGCSSVASQTIIQSRYNHVRKTYSLPKTWLEPKLKVIPLGVPEPEINSDQTLRDDLRNRINVDSETAVILLYGRINQMDKMDIRPLFCALRRIRLEYPTLKFLLFIAGAMHENDPIKQQLLNLAKQWDIPLAIAENTSLNLKKQLFAAADFFVSPVDNIQESFGLTLVEAAQAGLPVIATDWNGYKETVVHGETGLLIPTVAPADTPELDAVARALFNPFHQIMRAQQTAMHIPTLVDGIVKLASDPSLRQRMGKAAKERAAKLYTFDLIIDQWLDFWKELAKAPISKKQESIYRKAKHPLALDFGKVFACYASGHLENKQILQCTELGIALLEKRAPWNNSALTTVNIVEPLLFGMLEHLRQACSLEVLKKTAKQSTWGSGYSQEIIMAHVLWLLKQDLVAYE